MDQRKIARGELPPGVADLFFATAEQKLTLETRLRELFARWGYRPVIPPTFEYADTLASVAGVRLAEEMYRFFDRDGRALALRPDLTIPTARIVGVKLYDQPLPLRFSYVGSVFRYEEPRAGQRREFTQAGIELIGAPNASADAEVIALLAAALQSAGLSAFRITLGQIGFFRGLLAALHLSPETADRLRVALDRKSQAGVEAILAELDGDRQAQQLLTALPTLVGGPAVLDEAAALVQSPEMMAAVENLRQTWDWLKRYGIAEHITLDLGQVRGMAYYTGVVFEAFAPGVGFPLASGGRYDGLIGHFGPDRPAVGFALTVDRLLLALNHQKGSAAESPIAAVFQGCEHAECLTLMQQARALGARVALDVLGRPEEDLWAYARSQGIRRVVLCEGPGRLRLLADGNSRTLAPGDWESEVQTWIG
ncbi:MAG: ATP phosphoribosyltransferase regulatory subunit [Anaerolineae bacterium]|nr:ATP phosphoribosyltransferase regulatory subunit [Anaerolineae bacterium]MDW8099062.1 ATP phosphoribosyltransferase regulatory subunit [Anaerolineae bacterium]